MGVVTRRERHGPVERLHAARAVAGRPLYFACVHRVGDAVVDSGIAPARRETLRFLAEAPFSTVLTTHEHEDHVGNHEALPAGVAVWAPPRAKALLDAGPPRIPLYRRATWGTHGAAPGARPLGRAVRTDAGTFTVVPTPGHSRDHVAYLHEETGALFSGDAYMGRFKAARREEDVLTGAASLRRMAELDPATLFPAHGPALPRPRARLLETAEHFETLAARARALAEKGVPRRRIARDLLGPEPWLTWFSLGEFSTANMVENLLRP